MGGVPTEISLADWTAGYDGDRVNCESSSTPLRGTHNIKLLDRKSSNPKSVGKLEEGCFWTYFSPPITILVSICPNNLWFRR